MATDRANYTPEELRKGTAAVTDKAWTIDLRPTGPSADINHEGVAKAVLDAVLPGYTQRIQAHRPRTVWQERPGEISWRCQCGHVQKHEPLFPGIETTLLACPAAALAAEDRNTPRSSDEARIEALAPTPEQPPTQEIIETDRWGL